MQKDISSKLESLKTLRNELKDWKKDDLRKKKGIKQDPDEGIEQEEVKSSEDDDLITKLLAKMIQ